MKYLQKKQKNPNTGLIVAVVVLSIAVVVLLALLLWPGRKEPQPENIGGETVPTASTSEATENTTLPEETDPPQTTQPAPVDFSIATPYCDLYFPAEWEEQVTVSISEYEGGCTAVFSGKVDDREAYLFVILFEEGENQGNAVGSVTDESGRTAWVYLELNELLLEDSWNEEQANTLLAMQEGLNYLLETLKNDAAFAAAK